MPTKRIFQVCIAAALLTLIVSPPGIEPWSIPAHFVLNYLPVVFITLLLFFATGRRDSSVAFIAVALLGIRYLHEQKMAVLGQPLNFSDSRMLSQALSSPDLLLKYLTWPFLLVAATYLALAVPIFRREHPQEKRLSRLLGVVTAALGLFALLAPVSPLSQYYLSLPQSPWAPERSFHKKGLLAAIIQDYLSVGRLETPAADLQIIQGYKTAQASFPGGRPVTSPPDIVIWLSESFFDPGLLRGIDACERVPNFCRLAHTYPVGAMAVPTFGGRTVRTEFEILTGVPMDVIPEHTFPYLTLARQATNSIAWHLQSLGYATVAVHTHKREFWGRDYAMKNLGFDEWIGAEDLERHPRSGYYISDQVLTEEVVKLLERPLEPGQAARLIYAISMEAHGPWGGQPNLPQAELQNIPLPPALPGKFRGQYRELFYHLARADRELARLSAFVLSRKRPTTLLFFGDHLPGLPRMFNSLGFKNGLGPKQQKTPYLFVSNRRAGNEGFYPGEIAAWQLGTLLLKNENLLRDSQFAWFDRLYGESGWSREIGPPCQSEQCIILRQFQFQQLLPPRASKPGVGAPPT